MGMRLSKKSNKHKRPKAGRKTTTLPTKGPDDGLLHTPNSTDIPVPELLRRRTAETRNEFIGYRPTGFCCLYPPDTDWQPVCRGGENPHIDDFQPDNIPGVIVPAAVRALGAEVPPPPEPRA